MSHLLRQAIENRFQTLLHDGRGLPSGYRWYFYGADDSGWYYYLSCSDDALVASLSFSDSYLTIEIVANQSTWRVEYANPCLLDRLDEAATLARAACWARHRVMRVFRVVVTALITAGFIILILTGH
jgi:hypothetical protein